MTVHIGHMKTAAMVMLDIVVAGTGDRHAHNKGTSAEDWIADVLRDIVAMGPCSEARHLVPGECGLEVGNLAVVDDMRSAMPPHTDLALVAGNLRYSRLLHTERVGALIPCCAQNSPLSDRRRLAPLDRHLIVRDNAWVVEHQLPIGCPGQGLW